jgi:hypothetical protein
MAGGEGLILHRGMALTSAGERPFELVEKVCRVLAMGEEPDTWLYWKREALAYESGLLDALPGGLSAPRCFGVTYTDEPSARIFMEAVGDTQPDWTEHHYVRACEVLGRFCGAQTDAPDPARHPWMAPGRAHGWTAEAAGTLDALEDRRSDPVLSVWLDGASFPRTAELWSQVEVLRTALKDLPTCLCHHDAFRRNLLFRACDQGRDEIVAIDWAFAGYGVPGEELAAMVGASLMFMEITPDAAGDWIDVIFRSYMDGLRASGWSGMETDIRLGFCATTAMTFALGAVGIWLPLLRDPEFAPVVEGIVGVHPDRFLENLTAIHPVFLDLGEEAVDLIRS